jgi:hypothetical protein
MTESARTQLNEDFVIDNSTSRCVRFYRDVDSAAQLKWKVAGSTVSFMESPANERIII